jgi:drug/metabolite transporter (DMT)-like permease
MLPSRQLARRAVVSPRFLASTKIRMNTVTSIGAPIPVRRAPDSLAIALMVLLCAIWGLQQVAIKTTNGALGPMLQAGLRSTIAAVLVWSWAMLRGTPLFRSDGTLAAGVVAGILFAGEFICIFAGLTLTSASRMAVFLYTAPCFTALGLHAFVAGEKMRRVQWCGVAVAFAGIALAFADGFVRAPAPGTSALAGVLGDALGVLGGVMWAATTVVVRATSLSHTSASKTLFYQLVVSAVVLLALAFALGEPHRAYLTPLAVMSLAYQAVAVAFVSYLTWFWLLTRYMASRLSVFSFLTPLFGVGFGVALLGESFSTRFVFASALVLAGIVLVNVPARRAGSK